MAEAARCRVISGADGYAGKQGLSYFRGVSAQSVGATGLCLHLVVIPPGGRAKAHLHAQHESALYVLSGQAVMWSGEGLRDRHAMGPGDFAYIPAGVPHLPVNASATEPCTAVVARTDPSEQESVVLLPELDAVAPADFGAVDEAYRAAAHEVRPEQSGQGGVPTGLKEPSGGE